MVPINQVFLGGSDPLLGSSVINSNLDEQLQLIEKYKQSLEAARQMKQQIQQVQPLPQPQRLIWDEIDAEIGPMSEEQKAMLLRDNDYVDTYNRLQGLVQTEILNLVKGRIENTPEGKELLSNQLKIVKRLSRRWLNLLLYSGLRMQMLSLKTSW